MSMSREYTIRLLNMMDDGIVNPVWLAESLAMWIAERDVRDFCETELFEYFCEQEEEA